MSALVFFGSAGLAYRQSERSTGCNACSTKNPYRDPKASKWKDFQQEETDCDFREDGRGEVEWFGDVEQLFQLEGP